YRTLQIRNFYPYGTCVVESGRVRCPDIAFRTYAVGALSLRQSGTFLFEGVQLFCAERGKTAHKRIESTMLPQAITERCNAGSRNCVSPSFVIARCALGVQLYDIALDHEDHSLGDVGGAIGNALEV